MKRIYFFLITALLGLIYYTAGSPMEIADRVMVHAVGIDKTTEGYSVTLQVFSPEGGGTEGAFDPTRPNVSLVAAEGSCVSDAVHLCEEKLGGRVFIGQNRIILFGKGVDLSDEDRLFGYFLSSAEAYLNTECAAAENTARELLSIPIPSGALASEKFEEMIASSKERGCAVNCTLMSLLEAMDGGSPDKCVVMPQFSKPKSGSPKDSGDEKKQLTEDSGLLLDKGCIYMDGKRAGELDAKEMGLLGMINGSGDTVYTETEQDGLMLGKTMRISERAVSAEVNGGRIVIRVDCRTVPKDDSFFPDERSRESSDRKAAEKLTRTANELCEKLCLEYSPEAAGADRALRRYLPDLLRSCTGGMGALYGRIELEVTVADRG